MNSQGHFESLYRILVETEELLSGMPANSQSGHASYEERIAAMNERGWDLREDETYAPVVDSPAEMGPAAAQDRPLSERIGPTHSSSISSSISASVSPSGAPAAVPQQQSRPGEGDIHLSPEERRRRLESIAEQVRSCQACPLSMGRTNAVPGEGALDPMVMIVGEGPGYHEDQQGRPFVGKAGNYLEKWLEAIGITREESAFIANIVKCRPPNNRDPKPEESEICSPYLRNQVALVRPRLILTVGRISTRILTGSTQGITRIHGTFFRYEGIPLVPTFHPSAVLRNPAYRRPVWEDLKKVRNWLIDNAGHRPQDSVE